MDHYGVMGNPIHHSKSPLIHRLFAEQTQQDMQYVAILVDLDGLPEALDEFQARGGKGLNITLPFKHRAFGLMNQMSDFTLAAEAVNTILFNSDGTRYGDNTDGRGLVKDILVNHHFSIQGKRILVVGAGGAVSGVIEPLLNLEPEILVVANRTVNKAVALVDNFAPTSPIMACGLSDVAGQTFDLIINGTSASLQDEILELPDDILTKNTFCYDMVYGKGLTPFLDWSRKHGANLYCDGIGMLVEQAAESFYLWRDIRPDTQPVLKYLQNI